MRALPTFNNFVTPTIEGELSTKEMNKTLTNILKIILFFGLGLGILYLVYRSQNANWIEDCAQKGQSVAECGTFLEKIIRDFSQVKWSWIGAVLAVYTISNLSRAARWMLLLKPLGYSPRPVNAFFTLMIGYFANLGFPRIGEIMRPAAFSGYEKMPVEKVLGTIVTERITDVLALLVVMALAFTLEFDKLWNFILESQNSAEGGTDGLPLLVKIGIGLAAVGLIAAGLIWKNWEKVSQIPFVKKIVGLVEGLWEGVQTIRKMDSPGQFLFHTVNIWFMYFLMTYLGFFAFAPTAELTPLAGLIIFVTGALGIVIPTPGGLGSYNALVTAALVQFYGIDGADAFSFSIILFFSINIGCNVLYGLIGLIILPIINRNYEPLPQREIG